MVHIVKQSSEEEIFKKNKKLVILIFFFKLHSLFRTPANSKSHKIQTLHQYPWSSN